jgi:hypothetical protein
LIGVPTEEKRPDLALGELVWNKQNLYVVCGRGSLFRVEYVKVEGRKQVTAQEFGNGARIAPGERFGEVLIALQVPVIHNRVLQLVTDRSNGASLS